LRTNLQGNAAKFLKWQVTLCDPIWQVTSRKSAVYVIHNALGLCVFVCFLPHDALL